MAGHQGLRLSRILVSVAGSALLACGGDSAGPSEPAAPPAPPGPPGPATGSMRIITSTSGQTLDPDGYTVIIGSRRESVPVGGALTLTDVDPGPLNVELSGVSLNCFVSGRNPRALSVVVNQTVEITFNVACITPGGEQIAFNSSRDGNDEIYLMNSDGTGLVNLTNHPSFDAQPTWSPDGSKIAFTSARDGNQDIYVMNANGTGLVNLTRSPRHEYMPSWSPDGSRIAFVRDVGFPMILEIAIMNADGSGPTNISNNPDWVLRPAWSPNGTRLAFASDRDFESSGFMELAFEIYVTNTDGTNPVNLTNTDDAEDGFPAWSPDGSKIAFHSDRMGTWNIFVVNPDGSGVINLTDRAGSNYLPAWSPDGSRIAFESTRHGNSEVYVMKADGSSVVRLTDAPGIDSFPAWRP